VNSSLDLVSENERLYSVGHDRAMHRVVDTRVAQMLFHNLFSKAMEASRSGVRASCQRVRAFFQPRRSQSLRQSTTIADALNPAGTARARLLSNWEHCSNCASGQQSPPWSASKSSTVGQLPHVQAYKSAPKFPATTGWTATCEKLVADILLGETLGRTCQRDIMLS
jgi:hypothetical protein